MTQVSLHMQYEDAVIITDPCPLVLASQEGERRQCEWEGLDTCIENLYVRHGNKTSLSSPRYIIIPI